MKIGITLKKTAYTPEAYAYEKFLKSRGHLVQLDFEENLSLNNDVNIYFMGFKPFWKKRRENIIEIHEYQSLSTPPYAKIKDFLKTKINKQPDGRIFLNKTVQNSLNFKDNIPFITRDMGIDESFFSIRSKRTTNEYLYDIVYSGSIDNRAGLLDVIIQLAQINLKILLIGQISLESQQKLKMHKNVTIYGAVSYLELAELYAQTKTGLNFTPNIYPFNVQTSTKTLEYLASGMHVITNSYSWMDDFCMKNNYIPIFLNNLLQTKKLSVNNKFIPDLSEYSWSTILKKSNFEEFITELIYT